MKIGIDARLLDTHRPGVNRYVHNILRALVKIDSKNEYLCFVGGKMRSDLPQADNFRQVVTGSPLPQPLNSLLDLSLWKRAHRVDIFHSLLPLAPLFLPCPLVVTLHDFQPLLVQRWRKKYPEFISQRSYPHQKAIDLFYRFTYFHSLKQARRIICISGHTQEQLKQLFPSTVSRARVIYYGMEKKFSPIAQPELLSAVRNKYSLPDKFIFYAGTNRPNKNLPRLFQAIRLLLKEQTDTCPGLRLVLAGFEHPAYPSSAKIAADLGITRAVKHIGEVSHDELPAIYNLAETVVLISFLEGFGFPPIEAMACGTPVIVARDSSLPEVVGDAGISVDPLDVREIARAISLLWTKDDLRRKYSQLGLKRARIFNWERAGLKTVKVYSEIKRELEENTP